MTARRHQLLAAVLAASALHALPCFGEDSPAPDGVYGRFDGDLDLSLAAGTSWAREGPSGAVVARAFFLDTAGVYGAYGDSFQSSLSGPRRTMAAGISLRPLFIPRWGLNFERGPALLDLTIDATTIELGALWVAEKSPGFSRPPGVELALGTEIPLNARAQGPWIGLRGALRWRDSELAGTSDAPALRPTLLLTLAWHFVADTHIVDAGDRRFR